jgi:hypothetical protein
VDEPVEPLGGNRPQSAVVDDDQVGAQDPGDGLAARAADVRQTLKRNVDGVFRR